VELISVIIPVYNELRFLEACVRSVINQTYYQFELILVDDSSNNGAGELCDEFRKKDERIKVIHHEVNQGLSSSRISGLKTARGEWIIFVDDDDVLSPYLLETLISQINDEIDIVAGGRVDMANPDSYQWHKPSKLDCIIRNGRDIVEQIPSDRNQLYISTPLWGKIYRHSYLESINLEEYKTICPTIFFEDVLMTPILYSKAQMICIIKEPLYIHREVPTSISRSGKLSSFYYEQILSGDILLEYSKSTGMVKYFRYQVGLYIISILRIYCLMDRYLEEPKISLYRREIKDKVRKYRVDFYKYADLPFIRKLICLLFDIHPTLLKFVSNYYYKNI